jgi:hypothetical protein
MNRIGISICIALLTISGLGASTTYSQSVTSVTSVTITGATHGLGCKTFGARFRDGSGISHSEYISSFPIDGSTYDVVVNFNQTVTGTVKLQGCYNALTTASTDFQTTISADGQTIYVCASCTDAAAAVRKWATHDSTTINWVGVETSQLPFVSFHPGGTVYVWLDPLTHLLVFGTSSGFGFGTPSGGGATLVYAVGYPSGSDYKALARVTFDSSGFLSVTDDR